MKTNRNLVWSAIVSMAIVGQASLAHGAVLIPATGWVVHNGASTVSNGGTNSPTFTAADNITAMGTFPTLQLFKDGDSIKVDTTLTLATRTANTGVNALNTQLRIGLFGGPAGPVVASDVPNQGFIIEYTNDAPAAASRRLIREQTSAIQINPFTSPTNIGNGGPDAGNDSIRGANIGPVIFELMLTRNAGKLDITGKISGTDSVSGNPYLSNFSLLGQTAAPNGFAFNRVGFFLGDNVDAPNGTLNNVEITASIPEPGSVIVFAAVSVVGGAGWWQVSRASRRRVQAAR